MSNHSQIVIVGSGIVGCSAAYHFAQSGWKNVLVIDKGELFENDGSTSHAPGGVVALSHSKLMTQMAVYSSDLYGSLANYTEDRMTVNRVGGAEVAASDARWQDLIRLAGEAKGFGVEAHLMSPEEFKREKSPLIDASQIKGALFIEKGMIIAGSHVTGALARDAQALGGSGIRFESHTAMTGIDVKNGRIQAVLTNNPELKQIECEHLLICTNIWAPAMSEKLGFKLPLLAFEHQYAITEPLEALSSFDPAKKEDEITWPSFRDLDSAMYYRQHWNKLGVGSYWHAPRIVRPKSLGLKAGEDAIRPFTPSDFADGWELAKEMLPALQESKAFTSAINGMFAFSVDGYPIIGQSPIKGVWTAVASWITHAGGVAKSAVEMITTGETEWDMRQCLIDRFLPFQTSEKYIDIITQKNYAEVYDLVHPRQPLSEPRQIRLSPFYERFKSLSTEFTAFAGMELPNWINENSRLLERFEEEIPERSGWGGMYYSPIIGAEHLETRRNGSIWDLSGLSIIEVSGPDAAPYMNYLCSNEMDKPVGSVIYTTWLTPSAGVKRDLAVARLASETYWAFVGEGTRSMDLAWTLQNKPEGLNVHIRDVSDSYSAIGLFGPNARSILQKVTPQDVSNGGFPYYTGRWIEIGYHQVYAMRISYVGELGWELHIPTDASLPVWDTLWEAGREYNLIAAGLGSMDSMRLEKGYRLWGGDVYTEYNPYEAGLGWTVKLKKESDFIGKAACKEIRAGGIKKKLTCLTLEDQKATLFGYEPIYSNGSCIGHVTTANFGYSVGKYIAYGYLPIEYTAPGTQLSVEYFGERFGATVAKEPLFDGKNVRMKA
ncbi:MAG: FAD-dependent oxidoreductase [Chloroflexota bacterium]